MAKASTKQKSPTKVEAHQVDRLDETWSFKHGDVADIPPELIVGNDWNPNQMSADNFDMLSENVDEIGFLDYPLVVPLYAQGVFRVIDGWHRVESQRQARAEFIRCIVADPNRMDEVEQMKQTVRMNQIKGSFSPREFQNFVERFMEKSEKPEEDVPYALGFTNIDEFQELLDQARESLPNEEMKKEFDKSKDEIKTVDQLSSLLNTLFSKFGDTLPANFMILDFGGKNHIWVRMDKKTYDLAQDKARQAMIQGYTFDSIISRVLRLMDIDAFVEKHADHLELVQEEGEQDQVLQELSDNE